MKNERITKPDSKDISFNKYKDCLDNPLTKENSIKNVTIITIRDDQTYVRSTNKKGSSSFVDKRLYINAIESESWS